MELASSPVPDREKDPPDWLVTLVWKIAPAVPGSLSAVDEDLFDPPIWVPAGETIWPPDVTTEPRAEDVCSICIVEVVRGMICCTCVKVTPRIVPVTVIEEPPPALACA